MVYIFGNIIDVTLPVLFCNTINGQFNRPVKDKANLSGMRVFRKIHIFFKLHKNQLMSIRLRQISFDTRKRYIGFRQIFDRVRK